MAREDKASFEFIFAVWFSSFILLIYLNEPVFLSVLYVLDYFGGQVLQTAFLKNFFVMFIYV